MVLGVLGVDGDERHLAQVFAAAQGRRLQAGDFGLDGLREDVRQAVILDGDQADGALAFRVADALQYARPRSQHAAGPGPGDLETDELAVLGAYGVARRNAPFAELLLVDRLDDAAVLQLAENAELAVALARQDLDRRAGIFDALGAGQRLDAGQHMVADAGHAAGPQPHQHAGRRSFGSLVPVDGDGVELAVFVLAGHFQDGHRAQLAPAPHPAARPGDPALIG